MTVSAYAITTVITPPASADLTTLATWKDDWLLKTKDDDAFIRRAITRCSAAAAQYCNRVFGVATYQDVIRLERAYRLGNLVRGGRDPIMLGRWPLVSVASITETSGTTSTVLAPGVDFEVKAETGQLFRLDANGNPRDWPTCEIVVVYAAGYVLPGQPAVAGVQPLPAEIEDAVGRMVWSRYAERRRDPFVGEESVVGVGSVKFNTPTAAEGNLSADVSDLLDNHRVVMAA